MIKKTVARIRYAGQGFGENKFAISRFAKKATRESYVLRGKSFSIVFLSLVHCVRARKLRSYVTTASEVSFFSFHVAKYRDESMTVCTIKKGRNRGNFCEMRPRWNFKVFALNSLHAAQKHSIIEVDVCNDISC